LATRTRPFKQISERKKKTEEKNFVKNFVQNFVKKKKVNTLDTRRNSGWRKSRQIGKQVGKNRISGPRLG
jgi:hypothetical protein